MLYHVLFAVGQNVTIMSMCIVKLVSQFLWQFVMKSFFFDDFLVFKDVVEVLLFIYLIIMQFIIYIL